MISYGYIFLFGFALLQLALAIDSYRETCKDLKLTETKIKELEGLKNGNCT